jgi:L-amino acid N-acyltransferase
VVAWASLSRYHAREGYAPTVEDSLYVRHDRRGQGLGKRLLAELLARARRAGHHSIVAVIAADQPASLRLHEGAGFVRAGRLREVGHKLGVRLDVVFLQRMLAP